MECWVWDKAKDSCGYGNVWLAGKMYKVHRVVYEEIIGPIPAELELDHLCRNRACYNSEHLEAVTHMENMRRGKQARKTQCPQGHLYSGDNLYTRKREGGSKARYCKTCHNTWGRENRVKNKEEVRTYHREYMRKYRAQRSNNGHKL